MGGEASFANFLFLGVCLYFLIYSYVIFYALKRSRKSEKLLTVTASR